MSKWVIGVLIGLGVLAVLLVAGVTSFWFVLGAPNRAFVIAGRNMQPTLEPGQRVATNAAMIPRAGSIVAFQDPVGHGRILISRVVAVGGQTVDIKDSAFIVDGRPVDEPYVQGRPNLPGTFKTPVTVPDGFYWLMGDNRPNSGDSRYFGPVKSSDVVGVVTSRYWPPSEFTRFGSR